MFLKLCVLLCTMMESFLHHLLYLRRAGVIRILFIPLKNVLAWSAFSAECNPRNPPAPHVTTGRGNGRTEAPRATPDSGRNALQRVCEPPVSFTKVSSQGHRRGDALQCRVSSWRLQLVPKGSPMSDCYTGAIVFLSESSRSLPCAFWMLFSVSPWVG